MATITFENGQKVQFDGNPTPQDVEEVAAKLGIQKAPQGEAYPPDKNILQKGTEAIGSGVSGAFDFMAKDILAPHQTKGDQGFLGSVFQNTLGSKGLAGVAQLPGKVVNSFMTAGADVGVNNSNAILAQVQTALVKKLGTLQPDDPNYQMLQNQIQENTKALEQGNQTSQDIQNAQTSSSEALGTGLNAELTLLPFLKGAQVTSAIRTASKPAESLLAGIWNKTLGIAAQGLKPLIQTPVFGTTGVKNFFYAAGKRALQTGGQFAGFTTAHGLIEDRQADEIASDASKAFGLGMLGSGLFSTFITAPATALTTNKATSALFRFGLGFSRATQKSEERSNKMAADILINEGAGTARGLKERYEALATKSEKEIQGAIKNYMASTGRGGTFRSEQILGEIEKAYVKQFPNSLSKVDIQAFMESLPLDVLRRKNVVNVWELNQLRREITNKMISPTTFVRGQVQEGTARQLLTAGGVLAEKVKNTVRVTRPIFERYSAYMKGIDAALNVLATTHGPVNTGARLAGASAGALVGFSLGNFLGAGLGIGAEELARSTLGRTGIAVILRKLGYVTQNIAKDSLTQFGEMLAKQGIIKAFNSNSR